MNINTEQVFIVNASELDQHTSTTLQGAFAIPVAGSSLQPEEAQTSMCLSQSLDVPSRTRMCRLCATVTEMVVPIFEGEGLQNNLADKIHQHLPIQVTAEDVLPIVMCYQCTSTLLAWHELVECSIQADSIMKERFSLSIPVDKQQQNNVKSQQMDIKDEKSPELCTIIKNIVTQYLHSLNMDSQVELVCQSCESRPSSTIEQFIHHILELHSEVHNEDAVHTFIKEYVTFEEPLISDFESDNVDRDDSDDVESIKIEKQKKLVALLCPHCDSSFTSAARLVHHLGTHGGSPGGTSCCGREHRTRRDFVAHLQEKHVNRLVYDTETMCRSCDFTADSAEHLRRHVRARHEDAPAKRPGKPSDRNQKFIPAVCPACDRTFSNKYNMFTHMKSHEARAAPHACGACGRQYSSRGNLRQHERLAHRGLLPHVCPACGEAFPTRAARDVHARLHSGARPHRCGLCGAAFRARDSLRRHLDAHLPRRHACARCGRRFRRRAQLLAHARTHRA